VKTVEDVACRLTLKERTKFLAFCDVKGFLAYKVIEHPDRLKYPMVRQSDGKFKRVSWDDALNLVANKFKYFHQKYGKDSVAYYGSGQALTEETYTFNKLWKQALEAIWWKAIQGCAWLVQ